MSPPTVGSGMTLRQPPRADTRRTTTSHDRFHHGPQAHPQELRAHPRGDHDAEPDRGSADLVRQLPADEPSARAALAGRTAGGVQVGLPDPRLRRAGGPRLRPVRARGAEVRRRGMPSARDDLRRAAARHPAPDRLGRRRRHRLQERARHQGAGRLHGRPAADDRQRHLRDQRHRAGDRVADAPLARRVLRSRQGQDPQLGQVPVLRPHHSLSRLLAGLRVRRQGPDPRAHRPPPQAARDDAAAGAWSDPGRDPALLLRRDRLHSLRAGLEDSRSGPSGCAARS